MSHALDQYQKKGNRSVVESQVWMHITMHWPIGLKEVLPDLVLVAKKEKKNQTDSLKKTQEKAVLFI